MPVASSCRPLTVALNGPTVVVPSVALTLTMLSSWSVVPEALVVVWLASLTGSVTVSIVTAMVVS